MKNYKMPQILSAVCAVALLAFCALSFFAPFPATLARSDRERYFCVWQNGDTGEESYYSAFRCLVRFDGENVVVERDGQTGYISVGEEARRYADVMRGGRLNELLSLDLSALRALERAALAHTYAAALWYADGDYFALYERGVQRTECYGASVLSLLSGEPQRFEIERTGARAVTVHPDCTLTGNALRGTFVREISALPPYFTENGVLYRETPSGIRMIAAAPRTAVTAAGHAFADEGALLPCLQIEEVTLPFCGSDLSGKGDDYRGEFAHLFAVNREYAVPATLKKITITGGRLIAHAFYACDAVEEINCCGMDWREIHSEAFVDCNSLNLLHTPRRSVVLPFADYRAQRLPCGCTLYEKEGEV